MRPVLVLLLLIASVSCAPARLSRQEALMDEIEGLVQLPANAGTVQSYARYYTEYKGSVHGAYTTTVEGPRPPDFACSEMKSDDSVKAVSCPAAADVPVGQRRWVRYEDYPAVTGSGCAAIDLQYEPRTKQFTYLQCAKSDH